MAFLHGGVRPSVPRVGEGHCAPHRCARARRSSARTAPAVRMCVGITEETMREISEIAKKHAGGTYDGPPPGKQSLEGKALADQKRRLNELADKWKRERVRKEAEGRRLFGWTKRAEQLNCRMAMFGLFTGYVTELVTGDNIPEQVAFLARALGFL